MPVPVSVVSTPSTTAWVVRASRPSSVVRLREPLSEIRPHGLAGVGRYSSWKTAQMSAGVTSPPSVSVLAWMIRENSICIRRGRSSLWSFFRTYAMPPLPDWLLTRMTAS